MFEAKVCILGLGYIGLPTAVTLASVGHSVVGYDVNRERLKKLNSGVLPFSETGLAERFSEVLGNKKLQIKDKVEAADVFIICVPTPVVPSKTGPIPDTKHVLDAVDAISEVVCAGDLIVVESTCPVGTTAALRKYMASKIRFTEEVDFVCCPERVLPGNILHELVYNDRVVGGLTESSTERVLAP